MEQRVSWKTTLDAIVLTAGINNTFTVQLTPVVTDATPGVIDADYYRYIVRSHCDDSKKLMAAPEAVAGEKADAPKPVANVDEEGTDSEDEDKRAEIVLSEDEIDALYNMPLDGMKERARDMWLLGYFCAQRVSD